MVERIVGTEKYERLMDDIDFLNNLNISLLPLNIKEPNNTKKDYGNALGVNGGLYSSSPNDWTNQIRTYENNITSIENGNIGFLIKTGEESYIVVLDFDIYKNTTYNESQELLDLCIKRDTLIIRTPQGGYHIYFKYTGKLPSNRQNIYGNVDIRSNTGCLFYGYRDDGEYTISDKSKKIKSISPEILDCIFRYKKIDIKPFKNVMKKIDKATSDNKELVSFHDPNNVEKYNISDKDFKKLLFSLPTEYVNDYSKWLTITMICKKYGYYKIWEDWSLTSEKYNKSTNNKLWLFLKVVDPVNSIDIDLNYLIQILNDIFKANNDSRRFARLEIIHLHYKPINETNMKRFNTIINEKHLSQQYYNKIKRKTIRLIKSSLGTGKTYNMIQYAINNKQKILSIVHLKSLCENQVSTYNTLKKNLDPENESIAIIAYDDKGKTITSKISMVSTLNSLVKMIGKMHDIGEYVIYIDELHRIIEYLMISDTLDTNRRTTYTTFIEILKNCKGIVGTDGDINDLVFEFFDKHGIETECILNEYKSFDKIPVKFYNDSNIVFNLMQNMVNENKYFTCCCNTKTRVNKVKAMLINLGVDYEKNVRVYTRDEGVKVSNVNEQWDNKYIVYSPSIVEGIDRTSNYKETVFCFYDGTSTLTPEQVKQQICRNRNIYEVIVCFEKLSNDKRYFNYEECYNRFFNKKNNYKKLKDKTILQYLKTETTEDGLITNEYVADYFTDLYIKTKYSHSLMNANVKYLLKIMLEDIGFIVNDSIFNDLEIIKELIPNEYTDDIEDDDPEREREDVDENIQMHKILLKVLKNEPVLPTRHKLRETILKHSEFIHMDMTDEILPIIINLQEEDNKKLEEYKQKLEEDVKEVKVEPKTLNQTDSIKTSIKEQTNNEKTLLSTEYNNKIEMLKQDFKEYDTNIKNKWINDVITIDETYKINKEHMVLREAVKIKKEAEDIIKREKLEKKVKKETLDVEIKNVKVILAKKLIDITKRGDDDINKKLTDIKHIKDLKSSTELESEKRERYILKKQLEEDTISPEETAYNYRKAYAEALRDMLINSRDFTTFLNIRDGFILRDNELTNKLVIDNKNDKKIRCMSKNRTITTQYRYLMCKYLPDINPYDFKFNEFIDTFGNDKIEMTTSDVNILFDNIETKKGIPKTKADLVSIIKMLLVKILGDDMFRYSEHLERIDGKVKNYSEVQVCKYKLTAYILLANKSILPKNIHKVDKYFIEKYNMTGTYKKKIFIDDNINQECPFVSDDDDEDDIPNKFYGKRAIK